MRCVLFFKLRCGPCALKFEKRLRTCGSKKGAVGQSATDHLWNSSLLAVPGMTAKITWCDNVHRATHGVTIDIKWCFSIQKAEM